MRHGRPSIALLLAALLLAAAAAPAPAAAKSPCSEPRGDGPRALAARALCLVNRERAGRGLRRLRSRTALRRAAIGHANDMVRRRYFSHLSLGGVGYEARVRLAGYRGRALGEAIARGPNRRASAFVRTWLGSPLHRAVLLGRYRHVGLGAAVGDPIGGSGGAVLVLDAGR
jgi:uncharacterized protein YkwD